MINTKALIQLLTENTDGRLVLRWFIMTPNGSLLAYSSPADLRELRDQVALVSMTWKEQAAIKRAQVNGTFDDSTEELPSKQSALAAVLQHLTMEFDNRNVLVRRLQTNLLLVLEGGVPPKRPRRFVVTAEARNDPRYPPLDGVPSQAKTDPSPTGSVAFTTASTRGKRMNVLEIHRKRLDAMGDALIKQFRRDKFDMPLESDDTFY